MYPLTNKVIGDEAIMNYKNAKDILPQHLVDEIQKYASGEIIYIPKPKSNHLKWGEQSGSRIYIKERNIKIKKQFTSGDDIPSLSKRYHLSVDSIKKIVYTR